MDNAQCPIDGLEHPPVSWMVTTNLARLTDVWSFHAEQAQILTSAGNLGLGIIH